MLHDFPSLKWTLNQGSMKLKIKKVKYVNKTKNQQERKNSQEINCFRLNQTAVSWS